MAGWKSVEEIEAYQLAAKLRDAVRKFTRSEPAARDFTYRDQITDSSASVTRNLAEGFDRYYHSEFAQFASIAKGSVGETIDALKEGRACGYLSAAEFESLLALAERARKALSGLIRHLKSTNAPGEEDRPRRRRRRKKRD
jgi:four helix bundle protein